MVSAVRSDCPEKKRQATATVEIRLSSRSRAVPADALAARAHEGREGAEARGVEVPLGAGVPEGLEQRRHGHDAGLLEQEARDLQGAQIGKAIFSVFWSPLNQGISWCSKRFVGFIAIGVWNKRRLTVG